MVKQIVRPIKLCKWFPPDDPLAASIARLCILREDFMLETRGVVDIPIEQLDKHSAKWRKIYFLRRLVQSLVEIRSVVETLRCQAEFKELLSKQTQEEQQEFQQLSKEMNASRDLTKELRNKLGGHVSHGSVKKALEGMQPGREGLIEVGDSVERIHYKFASELVLEIMLQGVSETQRMERFESDLSKIGNLIPVLPLIDKIFRWYAVDRGLV